MDNATTKTMHVLLLAGTREARMLASAVAAQPAAPRLTVSLAGVTQSPAPYAGSLRIGGFGGVEGLADYLRETAVTHLINAAHPFAAGISRNAVRAAEFTGIPHLRFMRPAWAPRANWTGFYCARAACEALPPNARPFLALGSRHLTPFRHRCDIRPLLRVADPMNEPPFPATIIVGAPEEDAETERQLLLTQGVTHLVCRNSGGSAGAAKLDAAESLGLPVFIIERPVAEPGLEVSSVEAALNWLEIA